MTDRRAPEYLFASLSIANLANSAMGAAIAVGNEGWSVSALAAYDRTIAGTESGAANVAASLATLVRDLIQVGVLKGNYL